MDPLRIAVRALFAYLFLLVLLRVSGKQTIRHGTPFDFLLALIMGDLIDDALWNEVPMSEFVVAAGTLSLTKLMTTFYKAAPAPPWREASTAGCIAVAIACIGAVMTAGDRRTVVPGPDVVAEQLTRQVMAHRPAQTTDLVSAPSRAAYPPARLAEWGRTLEKTAGDIIEINGTQEAIDGDRAVVVVTVRGTRRTLHLSFALVREHGTWRVERVPDSW
jgi:hypothetical protein